MRAGGLPVFRDRWAERLEFPLSWLSGRHLDFAAWRARARGEVMRCLLAAPAPVGFAPALLVEEDRGSYVARKLAVNLSADSRVLAYLLVPKGQGPFPAVLLLHDHGARFDIGKEKVVRPWAVPPERLRSAEEWVERLYGGRFIGDELARRGYVCLATDALNWGDRGGAGPRLETRIWDVPHVFSVEMQEAAFDWLDQQLSHPPIVPDGARPLTSPGAGA